MTLKLGRALLTSGAITTDALGEALLAAAMEGLPLACALLRVGALTERRLEQELARVRVPGIERVVPLAELMDRLPAGVCHRLYAVPVRVEAGGGTVDVAVLDALDPHAAHEIGYHLRRPVRMVRASYRALREALDLSPVAVRALAAPMSMAQDDTKPKETIAWGVAASEAAPNSEAVTRELDTRTITQLKRASEVPIPLTRKYPEHLPLLEAEHDPVFELRRLGPPPTISDPEPPTVQQPRRDEPMPGGPVHAAPRSPPGPVYPPHAPVTSRAPLAPNAPSPPFADVGPILDGIREAEDRDSVLKLVQLGVRSVARRVALLVVKKDLIVGWSCTPEFGDEAQFRTLRIPTTTPNLLTATLSSGVYLGPLLGSVAAPLLRLMQGATHDVAIAAIKVRDRPTALILADELGDTLLATKRMEDLARAAGEALTRIVRARK